MSLDRIFTDKCLLITGGTGSFGNAVINKIIDTDIAEIRVFSRDEKKQEELRNRYQNKKIKFFIGDCRDYKSILDASRGVDYVFSAAALKQVPACEFHPMEAIKTNILGTDNTLSACIANKVKKVVVLSTDKAVYPINAMGMSKALMEKLAVAKTFGLSSTDTSICITRYGNVMGSRGSVIPLFIEQILSRKNLTITDPKMTRFMMSLDDAVNLVNYAFLNGESGDLFIQKSPAATIETLAATLLEIFESDLQIKTIGTRHGEKIYESLLSREEFAKVEDMGNYFKVAKDTRDLNYESYFTKGDSTITLEQEYTSHNTQRLDKESLKSMLLRLDFVQNALRGIKNV